MDSLSRHSPSSLNPAIANTPARDGKTDPEGALNGRAVQQGDPAAARTSSSDPSHSPPLQGAGLKDMGVRAPSASKAESKVSPGVAEMLGKVRGAAAYLAMSVPEKMGALAWLVPVTSKSEPVARKEGERCSAYVEFENPSLGPDSPQAAGKYLLAAATSQGPARLAQACFAAVDAAVERRPVEHAQVLADLLGQLKQAESDAEAPVFIESQKSQLQLARIALHCRIGKHMGVDSREAAREATVAGTGLDKHRPGIYGEREEGFRYAAGDYRTALKKEPLAPAGRAERMLLVAMNKHESLRAACTEVMSQVLIFDEAGEQFQSDMMSAALGMVESLKARPERK